MCGWGGDGRGRKAAPGSERDIRGGHHRDRCRSRGDCSAGLDIPTLLLLLLLLLSPACWGRLSGERSATSATDRPIGDSPPTRGKVHARQAALGAYAGPGVVAGPPDGEQLPDAHKPADDGVRRGLDAVEQLQAAGHLLVVVAFRALGEQVSEAQAAHVILLHQTEGDLSLLLQDLERPVQCDDESMMS